MRVAIRTSRGLCLGLVLLLLAASKIAVGEEPLPSSGLPQDKLMDCPQGWKMPDYGNHSKEGYQGVLYTYVKNTDDAWLQCLLSVQYQGVAAGRVAKYPAAHFEKDGRERLTSFQEDKSFRRRLVSVSTAGPSLEVFVRKDPNYKTKTRNPDRNMWTQTNVAAAYFFDTKTGAWAELTLEAQAKSLPLNVAGWEEYLAVRKRHYIEDHDAKVARGRQSTPSSEWTEKMLAYRMERLTAEAKKDWAKKKQVWQALHENYPTAKRLFQYLLGLAIKAQRVTPPAVGEKALFPDAVAKPKTPADELRKKPDPKPESNSAPKPTPEPPPAAEPQPAPAPEPKPTAEPKPPSDPQPRTRTQRFAGAQAAYERGEHAKALKVWLYLATDGDVASQFKIAMMFDSGLGTKKNHATAAYWYQQAARQGHVQAQMNLAVSYYRGEGVAVDKSLAAQWFRKAAEAGSADAQFNLALMLRRGEGGMRKNLRAALIWLRRAATQGLAKAQHDLGVSLAQGIGTPVNNAEALKWFREAAAQGHEGSKKNVRLLERAGVR